MWSAETSSPYLTEIINDLTLSQSFPSWPGAEVDGFGAEEEETEDEAAPEEEPAAEASPEFPKN